MKDGFLSKIASGVGGKKGRFITLGIWIIAIIILQFFFPKAADYKDDAAKDLPNSEPSVVAQKLIDDKFAGTDGVPALITWYRSTGLTNEDLVNIQKYSKELTENPVDYQKMAVPYDKMPPVALKQQVSKDGTTFIQTVIMKDSATSDQLTESFKQLESAAKTTIGEDPFAQKVSAMIRLLLGQRDRLVLAWTRVDYLKMRTFRC